MHKHGYEHGHGVNGGDNDGDADGNDDDDDGDDDHDILFLKYDLIVQIAVAMQKNEMSQSVCMSVMRPGAQEVQLVAWLAAP